MVPANTAGTCGEKALNAVSFHKSPVVSVFATGVGTRPIDFFISSCPASGIGNIGNFGFISHVFRRPIDYVTNFDLINRQLKAL